MSSVILDLTTSASYNIKVGRPSTQAKLVIHQAAVKSAIETLMAKIKQQNNIIGKYTFLLNSQFSKWTSKACFREELLPLGNWGSKKLSASESSFTKVSRLPTSAVCESKPLSCCHSHNLYIVKFYTSLPSKSEVTYQKI
jgi:hypothetical protein